MKGNDLRPSMAYPLVNNSYTITVVPWHKLLWCSPRGAVLSNTSGFQQILLVLKTTFGLPILWHSKEDINFNFFMPLLSSLPWPYNFTACTLCNTAYVLFFSAVFWPSSPFLLKSCQVDKKEESIKVDRAINVCGHILSCALLTLEHLTLLR